jgi:hypothetical protein
MAGQTIILAGARSRQTAHSLVDQAPERAVLTIAPPGRTLDQNALMWALLSDVSRAKPEGRCHTPDVWKELFMHACGHAVQFEMGLNGQPFPRGFRTSRLRKDEMSDLIECIYEYGARMGVRWTQPGAME